MVLRIPTCKFFKCYICFLILPGVCIGISHFIPEEFVPYTKRICLICSQRVHFDIQVGEHAVDYANVAQKEKLTELQLRVRQLLDQVEQITKEQNYQRVSVLLVFSYTVGL